MANETITEQDLLIKFIAAKKCLQQLKDAEAEAQKKFDEAEQRLLEFLNESGQEATGRYENIGWVSRNRPVVYANYKQEDSDNLFKYLRKQKRSDLIRKIVNPRSLSTWVKERLDGGKSIPPFVSYFLKTSLRYNAPQ